MNNQTAVISQAPRLFAQNAMEKTRQATNMIVFNIPSQTKAGKAYKVRLKMVGDFYCECPAFIFGKGKCKHIAVAQQQYENAVRPKFYGLQK